MLRKAVLAIVGVAFSEGVNVKHPWDLGFGVAPYRDGVYIGDYLYGWGCGSVRGSVSSCY